ncbi:MAG: biotin--[acetyl-CoA-carboxylase] ligase [Balneolaceae bacterium]|nr:biotin--[acetyl-CoA-carboxylase] ligase [Balneolaceae bacterium]
MFDVDKFHTELDTSWIGHEVTYFEQLDSTNSYLKNISEDQITHGMICLADNQTRGRGQYERNWESSPGQNLTFTVAFMPGTPERLHVLTLACAYALTELIREELSLRSFINWPNDVVVNDRKIAGLLTETVFAGNKLDRVLVGIGFNVNQERFSDSLERKATSMKLLGGQNVCRESLLAKYLGLMEYAYTRWHRNDTKLLLSINQKLTGYGDWVGISVNGRDHEQKYKLVGVNEKGQLTLVNQNADVETFSYEQVRLITD